MGEFSNLNGYDVKDKKAVRVYDNVEAMKDDYSIRAGQTVKTLGYYTANDGGSAEYIITDDDALTPDNMTIYQVGNDLFAELLIQNNTINVKQLGAYGDGTHDDTQTLQKILDLNYDTVIFSEGTYLIKVDKNSCINTDGTDTSKCGLLINSYKKLIGNNAIIKSYHETNESMNLYSISTSYPLEIDDITFNGQYSTFRYTYGIQLNNSDNIIKNCNFVNMGGSGIVLNGSSNSILQNNKVYDCKFSNCGNSIFCVWVNNSYFENIDFKNVSEGFDFDKKSTDIIISNLTANGYRGAGADALIELNGCERITIDNVNCINFIDGILINGKVVNEVNTISKDITISNCIFDTIDGYGIICGNSLGNSVYEIENVFMDNIIVKNAAYDSFHLRGNNIKLNNSGSFNSSYHSILIDNKQNNITISNFTSIGNIKGFIECTSGDIIKLINIYDDEQFNLNNQNQISNVTTLIIDSLYVINTGNFSIGNNRLFYINVTKAILNKINMPLLDTAIIFITSGTPYTINNSVCKLNTIAIDNPTVIISDQTPTEIGTSMLFQTGTILIVKAGETNPNIYICVRGNYGGGSIKWRSITGDLVS